GHHRPSLNGSKQRKIGAPKPDKSGQKWGSSGIGPFELSPLQRSQSCPCPVCSPGARTALCAKLSAQHRGSILPRDLRRKQNLTQRKPDKSGQKRGCRKTGALK